MSNEPQPQVPEFPVVIACPYCTAKVISGWVTGGSGERLALFNISDNRPHICRETG